MKIIQIRTHVTPDGFPEDSCFHSWYALTGDAIKEISNHSVECWAPERVSNITTKVVKNVTYKFFPAYQPEFHTVFSYSLLNELKKIPASDNTVVHMHGDRSTLTYMISILKKLNKNFNLVIQNLGSGGTYLNNTTEKIAIKAFESIEKQVFSNADLVYVPTEKIYEYYSKNIGIRENRIKFNRIGIDFNRFYPLDKKLSRNILNLPENKIILLYVGPFENIKGLEFIIKAWEKLRLKYDVELVAVGGSIYESLYPLVKRKLKYFCLNTDKKTLLYYYNASDVYCAFMNPNRYLYAGFGIAPMEALACNVPVVSNSIIHFPNKEEIKKIGMIPNSPDDIQYCIESIISKNQIWNCREIIKNHFDFYLNIKSIIKDYEKIISENSE